MLDFLGKITKHSDIILALGIVAILMVMLFPVNTTLLDILLALSVSIAIIILMTTLFIASPLELSSFPIILLITTMLRLSLNIASTRLILADGHNGADAAGHVIEAFGHFIMQGNVVIGLIVFLILTLINFVVITKGSGRIAEVAARFNLDAMPGKQMAVDSDLSSGLITETEAREKRKHIESENAFYGAMDGANKFVRGDAIAGIIITCINLVGGIIIGMMQRNLSFDKAIQTYSILTIGDGLVSQIPSLVVSLAAGLLVTRSGAVPGSADKALFGQLGKYPNALLVSAGVLALMSILPGIPFLPFMTLALIGGITGYTIKMNSEKKSVLPSGQSAARGASGAGQQPGAGPKAKGAMDGVPEAMQMEYVSLELGYGLINLVSENYSDQTLTNQIKALRKQIIRDLGFVMPSVRIQDNMQLNNNVYIVKVKELECGRGTVYPDKVMIMDPHGKKIDIEGIDTKEPTFGLPAKWVDEKYKEEALFNNYTTVDPSTVITTHLTEIVKENITELLSYTEAQKLIDGIGEEHKKLIKDNIPDIVTVSTIQKVLQNLLSESVSIRDLATIIEATADASSRTKNVTTITEIVRMRLSRQICYSYVNIDGFIPLVTMSPEREDQFAQHITGDDNNQQFSIPPSMAQEFMAIVNSIYDEQALKGNNPVLVTNSYIRPFVRSTVNRFRPTVAVISQGELHHKAKIRTVGVV